MKLSSYITGFILSVLLTLVAFGAVEQHLETSFAPQTTLVALLVGLAVVQLFVQLFFFLHFGKNEHEGWSVMTFLFAFFIVATFVGGSLWIMNHLDHNMQHLEFEGGVVAPHAHDD